jgi:hypothetical protein
MRQISNATTARGCDIMPHNVLLNMKREKKHHAHVVYVEENKSKDEEYVL